MSECCRQSCNMILGFSSLHKPLPYTYTCNIQFYTVIWFQLPSLILAMQSKGKHLRCRICGGFGLGLVRNVEKICTHCARWCTLAYFLYKIHWRTDYRETKAFFDPEKCKFCSEQGFYDISPDADGKILKKVVGEDIYDVKWHQRL